MNANPADCDCERCEIDRERALYQGAWLTAFREATTAQVSAALDAVENGIHRDAPEANGALLALTGLLLEQESELSDAVVGRAAGQQDQGEQSPMAAAEMEQRIGLMGRLNDAAARLRPQPEPEVADNDADLWYAACFACTTSLQVVRLFRSKRAELPQRDPMREAYLVVLTPLVGSAEENRERLEDTAIPDIDDGLGRRPSGAAGGSARRHRRDGGSRGCGFARIQPGPAGGNPAGHAGTARGDRTGGRDGDRTG